MVRRCAISRALPVLIWLSCLGISCQLASPQVENGAITGQVRLARGGLLPDRVQVTLQTRGITVNQVWTDTEGKFLFRDLPSNFYHVSITDDKYDSYEEEVNVEPHINPVNIITITLRPRIRTKTEVNSPIRGTNPYTVDFAEYERNFPKKAVKEFERGAESQSKREYDDAARHFQAALKLSPDFYPAHNDLGAIYVTQGRFAEAEEEFDAVLKVNQSDTEAYFNLGNVLLLTNRYEEASRMVEEGLKREPISAYGQFLLGSVCEREGRITEAEQALREAIRLDPALARAHLQLVNLYLREQRTSDAIAELKFFLKNFPSDPLAQHASEALRRLTK